MTKPIRASEIGLFLYCRRAWWYARQGVESTSQAELLAGSEMHRQHGRSVVASAMLRTAASVILLLALMSLVAFCTSAVLK